MSSATFRSIRASCRLRFWAATISTQRITGSPVARMMENWEQISASSFSLILVRSGRVRTLSFFSRTASSLVTKAQVARSFAAASYSSYARMTPETLAPSVVCPL